MRKLLTVGALAAFLFAACTSISVQDDGTLESIKTKGTASVTLEMDDQLVIKKVEVTSDGENAVPLLGGFFEALQDLGGRFLGGGGSNTTVIQASGGGPAMPAPTSAIPEPEPGG